MMPTRQTEFGPEKYCHQCADWWPETDEFFFRDSQTKSHNLRSPCKACIVEKRKTNAGKTCCVPGCDEPRCHWRHSRCRRHQAELDAKAKVRKAVT